MFGHFLKLKIAAIVFFLDWTLSAFYYFIKTAAFKVAEIAYSFKVKLLQQNLKLVYLAYYYFRDLLDIMNLYKIILSFLALMYSKPLSDNLPVPVG